MCNELLQISGDQHSEHRTTFGTDSLAEWSKALAPGASPQGRGFDPPQLSNFSNEFGNLALSERGGTVHKGAFAFSALTVWPSGLRRWLKAPVRKGVGSNPTAVIRLP